MVRSPLPLVATAILVAPAIVGVASPSTGLDAKVSAGGGPAPHPPIWIQGDEGFEDPIVVSGVRGGNGTAANPYVIGNWTIAAHGDHAIRLEGTDAHVVIESVLLRGRTCTGDHPSFMCVESAIDLVDADNVTVRDAVVLNAGRALDADEVDHLRVERVDLGATADHPYALMGRGIGAYHSRDVVVRNATIEAVYPVHTHETENVTIEDATLVGEGGQDEPLVATSDPVIDLPETRNVTLARTVVEGAGVDFTGRTHDLTVAHSRFLGSPVLGLADGAWGSFETVTVCGSAIRDMPGRGLDVSGGGFVEIRGNAFEGNEDGAHVALVDEATVERNRFRNNTESGLVAGADRLEVHENAFEDNGHRGFAHGQVLKAEGEEAVDARANWWGHEDGPHVRVGHDGPVLRESPGDQLTVDGEDEVDWSGWLGEPPEVGPGAVDCGVPGGQPGADRAPDLPAALRAEASAGAGPASAAFQAEAAASP